MALYSWKKFPTNSGSYDELTDMFQADAGQIQALQSSDVVIVVIASEVEYIPDSWSYTQSEAFTFAPDTLYVLYKMLPNRTAHWQILFNGITFNATPHIQLGNTEIFPDFAHPQVVNLPNPTDAHCLQIALASAIAYQATGVLQLAIEAGENKALQYEFGSDSPVNSAGRSHSCSRRAASHNSSNNAAASVSPLSFGSPMQTRPPVINADTPIRSRPIDPRFQSPDAPRNGSIFPTRRGTTDTIGFPTEASSPSPPPLPRHRDRRAHLRPERMVTPDSVITRRIEARVPACRLLLPDLDRLDPDSDISAESLRRSTQQWIAGWMQRRLQGEAQNNSVSHVDRFNATAVQEEGAFAPEADSDDLPSPSGSSTPVNLNTGLSPQYSRSVTPVNLNTGLSPQYGRSVSSAEGLGEENQAIASPSRNNMRR